MPTSDEIKAFFPDEANDRLYWGSGVEGGDFSKIGYVTLSNHTNTTIDSYNTDDICFDVIKTAGNTYILMFFKGNPNLEFFAVESEVFSDYHDTGDDKTKAANITPGVVIGGFHWFLYKHVDTNVELWKYEIAADGWTMMEDCGATSDLPTSESQWGIAYDDSDVLYFILKDTDDSKMYLYSYIISTDTLTKSSEHNIALMLNRNTNSSNNPPFNLEKGFHVSDDKIYQIPSVYNGRLNLISVFDFSDTISAITDHYIIDSGGKIYEIIDQIAYIFEGWIFNSRNSFPYFEMKFNSDYITFETQQFIQIIGPYTVDGSTTADQVVFEGITVKPTKGRVQFVLVVNQGSEMDKVKPRGNKSGRSDQIISDINDDGAPDGPTYIKDGTLANGGAMGMLDLSGAKIYRTVLNDFAEHDAFLWSLRPQGALDYNNGSIDSGADIRNDIITHTDVIVGLKAWTITELNQIIVNGAINPITGIPYTGKWDEEEDQLVNGINPITIEDSQLNSAALCQAKADTMGGNEAVRTRARFKFRKTTYGLIQVGQTITFLYDITDYITIAQAQFILDKLIMNIKTEVGYAEISSGL